MFVIHNVLDYILAMAWRFPLANIVSPRIPTTLLYHSVPQDNREERVNAATFKKHVEFLARYFDFISPGELDEGRSPFKKPRVLLTFDDGMSNNAGVIAPILKSYSIPAVFFVSSRHSEPGKYLWPVYLQMLEKSFKWNSFTFRGEVFDMSRENRKKTMARLRQLLLELKPHPGHMYDAIDNELPPLNEFLSEDEINDRAAGMTADQVGSLAADPLFTVGGHTVDHPFLTFCESSEAFRQLVENKLWLEAVTGKRCRLVAYPMGDYNCSILQHCINLYLSSCFAVEPKFNKYFQMERPRLGVYGVSTEILGFKAQWGNYLRGLKVKIG